MEVQIEFYRLFHKLRDFSEQLSGENPNPILYICAALRSILITKYNHRYAKVLLSQTNLLASKPRVVGIYSQFVDLFVETIYTTFNLGASLVQELDPFYRFLFIPYLVQWSKTIWGIFHPATNGNSGAS